MTVSPPDVGSLFAHGARHRWASGKTSRLDVVRVGDLSLPTGSVIARDPARWVQDDAEQSEPFTVVAPAGMARITMAVAHWDESPDPLMAAPIRRPVAVRAELSDAVVRGWELGLRPGEQVPDEVASRLPGFSVDAGIGCLMDLSALGFLRRLQREDEDELDLVLDAVGSDGAEIATDPESDASIFVFACGMGDGVYSTWIGRNSEGVPVSLVIDLELLWHSLSRIE